MTTESGKQIRQMGFCEISPQFPKEPEEPFYDLRSQSYRETLNFWEKVSNREDVEITSVPENPRYPRLCDVRIPWIFVPLLDRYIKRKKNGLKATIPLEDDIFKADLFEYVHPMFTVDSNVSKAYREWSQEMHFNWTWPNDDFASNPEIDKPIAVKKLVYVTTKNRQKMAFYFSDDGELLKFGINREFPLNLPHHLDHKHTLNYTAGFKNEKLVFLWHEEPNGIIFPDIRGPREQIYPWWVNNMETETGEKLKNENVWLEYLKRIKNREPVTSGRTFKRVLQTEKMAKNNLERWQNYIFYKNPQVFQFRLKPFKSEIGYRLRGKWGYFISNNPNTHKNLSSEETQEMIQKYNIFLTSVSEI